MQGIDVAWRSILGDLSFAPVILSPHNSYCEYCGISIPDTGFSENICAKCREMEDTMNAPKDYYPYFQISFCRNCGSLLKEENIKIEYQCHPDVHASEALYTGYQCKCGHISDF